MINNLIQSEPTEKEIEHQTNVFNNNTIQLLISLRKYCQLSICKAAELLGIDRKRLSRYEHQSVDMSHKHYCKYVGIYLLYIGENKIIIPDDIEKTCNYLFVNFCNTDRQDKKNAEKHEEKTFEYKSFT